MKTMTGFSGVLKDLNRAMGEKVSGRLWMVTSYNELDAEFGYDPGPSTIVHGLSGATARAIAKHMNKTAPGFVSYAAVPEPDLADSWRVCW